MFISEPSRGPNGKLSSIAAPQMWPTPRMPGNDVATKSTELACDRIADASTRAGRRLIADASTSVTCSAGSRRALANRSATTPNSGPGCPFATGISTRVGTTEPPPPAPLRQRAGDASRNSEQVIPRRS